MSTIKIPNDLLLSLEDLGSLSENSGLYEIKPFRDWKGTNWRNKVFSMRLCNAGEIQDIDTFISDIPEHARIQVTKLETILRSVFAIDGRLTLSPEDLVAYNEKAETNLSHLQLLRIWSRNLEQIVVNRLDAVYGGLELKQVRQLQHLQLCEGCGMILEEIPKNARKLKHCLGEFLCEACLVTLPDVSIYDFEDVSIISKEPSVQKSDEIKPSVKQGESFEFQTYTCACGKELETFEEFVQHRETCPKAGNI
jgi:hypothetical protein